MQKKYIVESNLKNDTGYHNTGDIILMDEEQAAPLVAIGCLKPAVEDITPPPVPAVPDGFPQHQVVPPTAEQKPAVAEPVSTPPANPINPVTPPQTPPKQPTQEQIAKDMEQI